MRRTLALAMAAALFFTALEAGAEITVETAEIAAGELVVSGRAAANAEIVLDDRVRGGTDAQGRFTLRAAHFPEGCIARLRSGNESRDVVVAGCGGAGRLALRQILVETCAEPYCEVVCRPDEAIVSSYCLGTGQPTFTRRESGEWVALCPGTSSGIAGFCAKL